LQIMSQIYYIGKLDQYVLYYLNTEYKRVVTIVGLSLFLS